MTPKGLDVKRLAASSFTLRQAEIRVPEMAEFFPEGEDPVWVVRQLTGAELAHVREAADNLDKVRTIVQALSGGGEEGAPPKAVLDAFGLNPEETPADLSRRIETLMYGSVRPAIGAAQRSAAVVVAENYPMQFYSLTNRIMDLTGAGAEVGKRKRSGPTKTSA